MGLKNNFKDVNLRQIYEEDLEQGETLHGNEELKNEVMGNSANKLQEELTKQDEKQLENGLAEHIKAKGENEATKFNGELEKELEDHEEKIDSAGAEGDAVLMQKTKRSFVSMKKQLQHL